LIIIHPQAAAEAKAARAWYAKRNPATGVRFLGEYDRAIDRIRENPRRWPEYPHVPDGGFRWYHFRRFPYAVIYEVLSEGTHVLAVAADRRRPGYWRKRGAMVHE
jgi:plasmid stabilization system protein ParE